MLTCEAWLAAFMLLPDDEAEAMARHFERVPGERSDWARGMLLSSRRAPYAPDRWQLRNCTRLIYNAVGGVDLAACDPVLRLEVVSGLRKADYVSVRDRVTQEALSGAGIAAQLAPDCATLTKQRFDVAIQKHGHTEEPAAVRAMFPQGYLAVQFSADCGDDATLASLARELDAAAGQVGHGIVFFRAGIAPWHDAPEPFLRLSRRMQTQTFIFESAHIWDICALIAGSIGFVGTSLHGRIVAAAYALPRISFLPTPIANRDRATKQAAYVAAWEMPGMPGILPIEGLSDGIPRALHSESRRRAAHADRLEKACRAGQARWLNCRD